VKTPVLLAVVRALDEAPSARAACTVAGVTATELPGYRAALAKLARSQMITGRAGR
jgi:mycofactocin biosynthesis protein MftB